MPYITKPIRACIVNGQRTPQNAGELNFLFTDIIQKYLLEQGLCYQHINDVIGALEGAKLEFNRRVVAPYEDTKIKENTDVYDKSLLKSE